jgi:FkbM family methyltransferase
VDAASQSGEFEIVEYPFAPPGKRRKRMCVPKGDDVITILMKTARSWEYGKAAVLYERTARGGSFVEVGANIGTDTVLASDFFKICYAFEPSSKHKDFFRRNMEMNEIRNVQLFTAAVSDQCGTTRLYYGESGNTGSAALRPNFAGMDRYEEVPMVTLDSALPEVTDVTFLHVDAEGQDIKVLEGARKFIARQAQQPYIQMEFQPRTLSLHGSQIADLVGFMDEMKYGAAFNAQNFFMPMSAGVLIDLFYSWRKLNGWIDLYLWPLN